MRLETAEIKFLAETGGAFFNNKISAKNLYGYMRYWYYTLKFCLKKEKI